MKCNHCGCENSESAVFCKNCGKKLTGTVFCPSCGKQIDSESNFCMFCGSRLTKVEGETAVATAVQKPAVQNTPTASQPAVNTAVNTVANTAVKPQTAKKVLNYLSSAFVLALAVFSLIFVFLIGFSATASYSYSSPERESTYLYYYFSDAYHDLERTIDYAFVNDYSKASLCLPVAFGTAISAVTLILTAVFSILAIVWSIKYLIGKSENNGAKFAYASFLTYVIGFTCLLMLNNFRLGDSDMKMGVILNGATIAGVVLCSICACGRLCCVAIDKGKELEKPQVLIKFILSLVSAVFIIVVLALCSLPTFGTKSYYYDPGDKLHVGITTLMAGMGIMYADEKIIGSSSDVIILASFALVSLIALIIVSACLIRRNVTASVDNDKSEPFFLNGVAIAIAVIFLVLSIFTAKQFVEAAEYFGSYKLQGGVSVTSGDFAFTYAVPITAVVFTVLSLVVNIVQYCIKKSYKSAGSQPVKN